MGYVGEGLRGELASMLMLGKRPIVWIAACWVGGSAAAAVMSSRGALFIVAAMMLIMAALAIGKQASWKLAVVGVLAFSWAAGERLWADARNVTMLQELLAAAEQDGTRSTYPVEASGTIISTVEVDGDRVMLRMKANHIRMGQQVLPLPKQERLMVHVRLEQQPEQELAAAWNRGDLIRVAGELELPASATNSGGFDYRRYLSSQRIHWLLKAKGTGSVSIEPGPPWTAAALLGRVDAARTWLGERMNRLYAAVQAGFMKGLVLGLSEELDPEQFQQFSRLGLTHILAISGLHVAVYMYAITAFLRLLRLSRERILLSLMIAVPLYVLLAGASPSIMRAGIMAMLGLVAARMGKLKDGLHILAAAALVMLIFDPYLLNDVSFQLSFIVTAGLILGVPPVRRMMPNWSRGKGILDLAAVTIVAQLVSFPITIYYFNQFHILSFAANFILVPFISSIVLPAGALSLLISIPWDTGAKLLAKLLHYANEWTYVIVEKLGSIDQFRMIWATPPVWWVLAWLLTLGIAFQMLDSWTRLKQAQALPLIQQRDDAETMQLTQQQAIKKTRRIPFASTKYRIGAFVIGMTAVALLVSAYYPNYFNQTAAVSVLDVGQGDAILIRTASGKHMLIDGGGTKPFRKPGEEWKTRRDPFEVGSKVVVPLLLKRGVQELDLLVISHLDSDHFLGLLAVIEQIPIKRIWWNGTLKDAEDAKQLLRLANAAQIPLFAVHQGLEEQIDEFTSLQVLWPLKEAAAELPIMKDQNEASVVLTVRLYDHTFLFSGDINAATEQELIQSMKKDSHLTGIYDELAPVHMLKVAHHGSRFSTGEEWLDYWQPVIAVASASATNSYGHPHPDVLGRLNKKGVLIRRTDTEGEIQFLIKKKKWFVRK